MKTKLISISVLGMVCFALLSGCITRTESSRQLKPHSQDETMLYGNIIQKLSTNPDTDGWREQRQKLALATGDRVFDTDFPRVFDSLVQAVSSLELKVGNMERQSGYISASGVAIPPAELNAMGNEAIKDWCRLNGYDSSVFDHSDYLHLSGSRLVGGSSALAPGGGNGLTFQLVKMGAKQTKVKLRFSGIPYPRATEAYYKLVWQAVDKQIFVDNTIEGEVEKRH